MGYTRIIEKLNTFFASYMKFSLRLVKDSVIKIFGSLVLVSFFFVAWTLFRTDLQIIPYFNNTLKVCPQTSFPPHTFTPH